MEKCLINGTEEYSIDVQDRGLHYGDGVFETIAFKNKQIELWPQHLQRLQTACERLGLHCVAEQDWLDDLAKMDLQQDCVIKLILTRGVSGRGYAYDLQDNVNRITAIYPWPQYSEKNVAGITAGFCKTPVSVNPALAGIKHLNRLDNVMARNEVHSENVVEAFMLDSQQHVIEGTMSNVFCIQNNELYTPQLNQCGVSGVMRQQLISIAKTKNIPVNVVEISKQNFLQMDGVFVCNSLIGLWPVKKIIDGSQTFKFMNSELVTLLQSELKQTFENLSKLDD